MKKKFVFLTIVVLAAAAGGIVLAGFYPVAFVNGQPITMESFKKNYGAAFNYYKNSLQTYDKSQMDTVNSSETRNEIGQSVMGQLVENVLIRQELEKEIKKPELETMIENKIQEALNGKDINTQVEKLLGLSLEEFKNLVLKPQAEKEIISGRLFLENKNINDWLAELESKAKITILLPGLEWKNNEVVIK